MIFASREDAGQKLGRHLRNQGIEASLVLGLPRGGVVVAAQVAQILRLPMDALVVRKIGHPWHREFAVGAMAEHGVVLLDEAVIGRNPLVRGDLEKVIREEKERLRAYESKFHAGEVCHFAGQAVIIIDDGLATGATTEAAVLAAKKEGASRMIVAAPVASTSAVERLERVADEVQVLLADPDFEAVGRYYEEFTQTTDEEALAVLAARRKGRGA